MALKVPGPQSEQKDEPDEEATVPAGQSSHWALANPALLVPGEHSEQDVGGEELKVPGPQSKQSIEPDAGAAFPGEQLTQAAR